MDALGTSVVGKHGRVSQADLAAKRYVLLYFSAHWCPPCRGFTPKLSAFYQEVTASGSQVEVIFVSFDRSKADFDSYWGSMPFATIDYDNQALRESLGSKYGVRGIPALILLNANGDAVKSDCRADVESSGPGALAIWDSSLGR
jgi:nucleoredoxin